LARDAELLDVLVTRRLTELDDKRTQV